MPCSAQLLSSRNHQRDRPECRARKRIPTPPTLSTLSPEIIANICDDLDHSSVKALSLLNWAMQHTVRSRLFTNISFSVSRHWGERPNLEEWFGQYAREGPDPAKEAGLRISVVLNRWKSSARLRGDFSMITGITVALEIAGPDNVIDLLRYYRPQLKRLSIVTAPGPGAYATHEFYAALLQNPLKPLLSLAELELRHCAYDEYGFINIITALTPNLLQLRVEGDVDMYGDGSFYENGALVDDDEWEYKHRCECCTYRSHGEEKPDVCARCLESGEDCCWEGLQDCDCQQPILHCPPAPSLTRLREVSLVFEVSEVEGRWPSHLEDFFTQCPNITTLSINTAGDISDIFGSKHEPRVPSSLLSLMDLEHLSWFAASAEVFDQLCGPGDFVKLRILAVKEYIYTQAGCRLEVSWLEKLGKCTEYR
jgi:hypothetical protein